MTDLARQIERAKPVEQWAMLVTAWEHIYGAPAVQSERGLIYHRLLSVNTDEAFIGAALMLVKDGWEWGIDKYHIYGSVIIQGHAIIHSGEPLRTISGPIKAATPALAIAAACVRAHDAKEEG